MARTSAAAPPATPAPEQAPPRYTHRQIMEILAGLMMAMLTSMISTSVVGTALPTIVGELGGQDQLSWVASATLLTMTASTPLWGKLSDIFGRKLMFQSALLIFVLASVAAGASQDIGQLITARAFQGLGVGGLSALAQVIIGDVVEPRQRGRYAGYMGAVFGISTVAGPLLGGFLVDADSLGWRWCFYVCVPLAVIAFIVIQKVLKLPRVKRDTRLDVFGAFTITGAASLVMLLLSLGGKEFEWNSAWTYGMIAGAVVLVILAVFAERGARDPILPPRLFRNPTFLLTSFGSLCIGIAMFGAMIYLPQFLQIVKGMSPTESGLMTLPLVGAMFVTSTVSGQLVTRTGRWKIFPVVGLACVAVALFMLSRLHTDSSNLVIGVDMAVLGFGMGLTLQILILAAQNAAAPADLAATTSGVSFFRNLGGAMGVAAYGAILSNRLAAEMEDRLSAAGVKAPPGDSGALGSPDQIHALPQPFQGIVLESFTKALEMVFLVGMPIAVLGLIAVLALKEIPLRGSSGRGAAAPAAGGPAPVDAPAAASAAATAAATAQPGRHARGRQDELVTVGAPVPEGMSPNGNGTAPSMNGTRPLVQAETAMPPVLASAEPQQPRDGGGLAIRGYARDGDGAPVPSVALTLIDAGGQQLGRGFTGPDGSYTIAAPGPGTYVLIAATGEHEPQAATLVVGDRPVDFDLRMAGSGGLAGTVRGANGVPIEGAMVVVTDVRGEVVGTGRTGNDGGYLFKDVVAGAYTLAVSAAAHRPIAVQAEVTGNGRTVQDVDLPPGAHVRGTIRNAAGEPIGDARVTLVDAAGNVVAMVVTGPDGEYAFADLVGGQYTVIASGYPPVATSVSLSGSGRDEHDMKLGYPDE
ncbi:MFS transporter [Spirillospora sp. NPDC029432]|uniref:MFS transporter n=1 Tax=Spirillospora sp. NPDC029432 TaxID=3154599 RepID=UPI003451A96A